MTNDFMGHNYVIASHLVNQTWSVGNNLGLVVIMGYCIIMFLGVLQSVIVHFIVESPECSNCEQ